MINIKEKLISLTNPKLQKMNETFNPSSNKKQLGISVTLLRKEAKEYLKEYSIDELFLELSNDYFDEILFKGLLIGYAKVDIDYKIKLIKKYLKEADSWGLIDSLVPTLKLKDNELDKYWEFILSYLDSKNEFEVRFSIVMMLYYFLDGEHIDLVIEKLDNIKHDGYYVKMAVAWTLCEIGILYKDKFLVYIENNNLDKFTYNKALQKLTESFRVSKEDKEYYRSIKIK